MGIKKIQMLLSLLRAVGTTCRQAEIGLAMPKNRGLLTKFRLTDVRIFEGTTVYRSKGLLGYKTSKL